MNIFFQTKYTEDILSNSTRKLLGLDINKMLIAVYKKKLLFVLFIIIFRSLSFSIGCTEPEVHNVSQHRVEWVERKGRKTRERGWRARLEYLSRVPEFL